MGFRRSAAPALFAFSIAILAGCNSSSEPQAETATTVTTPTSLTAQTTVTTPTRSPSVTGDAEDERDESPVEADRTAVMAFAEATEAEVVVARLGDGMRVLWHDGRLIEVAQSGYGEVWSDGNFVYYWAAEGGRTLASRALTLDGTVVCEAQGPIHHATRRSDGSFVMAVEPDDKLQDWDGVGEYGVPLEAVDCQTGDRQPIEPVLVFGGDGATRFVERLAGRVFTGYGDAEGNAEIVNERAVSINGDDYAGYHTFNHDASIVIYGDMGSGAGPHLSSVVVGRNTDTGEQLWRKEFDIPFRSLGFLADRAVIGFVDDEQERFEFVQRVDRAVLLDATTGAQLAELEVGFDLLYVG